VRGSLDDNRRLERDLVRLGNRDYASCWLALVCLLSPILEPFVVHLELRVGDSLFECPELAALELHARL
jgi:hypothetical protein